MPRCSGTTRCASTASETRTYFSPGPFPHPARSRTMNLSKRSIIIAAVTLFAWQVGPAVAADKVKIAMVVKSLGNGFFDAAHEGGKEAAKELGDVELIYTGPTAATAEAQIEVINSLVSQKVDALAISANDKDALVPIARRAAQRGIKVISFDSGIAPAGRILRLNPSNNALIGTKLAEMAAEATPAGGEIAVLSATAQATNQNIWIAELKKVLAKPEWAKLKLIATVYGDDQSDKSYREALGL